MEEQIAICAICHENLINDTTILAMDCGHVGHENCLETHRRYENTHREQVIAEPALYSEEEYMSAMSNKCPVCRHAFQRENYMGEIFLASRISDDQDMIKEQKNVIKSLEEKLKEKEEAVSAQKEVIEKVMKEITEKKIIRLPEAPTIIFDKKITINEQTGELFCFIGDHLLLGDGIVYQMIRSALSEAEKSIGEKIKSHKLYGANLKIQKIGEKLRTYDQLPNNVIPSLADLETRSNEANAFRINFEIATLYEILNSKGVKTIIQLPVTTHNNMTEVQKRLNTDMANYFGTRVATQYKYAKGIEEMMKNELRRTLYASNIYLPNKIVEEILNICIKNVNSKKS